MRGAGSDEVEPAVVAGFGVVGVGVAHCDG